MYSQQTVGIADKICVARLAADTLRKLHRTKSGGKKPMIDFIDFQLQRYMQLRPLPFSNSTRTILSTQSSNATDLRVVLTLFPGLITVRNVV